MGFWKQLTDKNNWIPRPQNPGGGGTTRTIHNK